MSPAVRLLAWCAVGTALVHLVLWRSADVEGLSLIFTYLLRVYDAHGNFVLMAVVAGAFVLRRRPDALWLVRFAAERPWTIAALMFALLSLGSLFVYRAYPVSMDEYAALFQAKVFAAGKLSGTFPPELLDRLIPRIHQGTFLSVSRSTGAVAETYLPGFALLLAPFAWLGVPWAANPLIGALTIPAIHRLTLRITASREAAGWAVLLTAASPAFIVTSISFYSMAAHLLLNVLYALLLLSPSVPRALLAGLIGSLALVLHQPVPHLVFGFAFVLWLLVRPRSAAVLTALFVGYLPSLAVAIGWQQHLADLGGAVQAAAPATEPSSALLDNIRGRLATATLPSRLAIEARIAGFSKDWTWSAPALLVLALYGYRSARAQTSVKLLGAALAVTFFAYFLFPLDQGHGWGDRYLYSAWFALPVLGAVALAASPDRQVNELRSMAAWAIVFSLLVVDGFRLLQVHGFIGRQLAQVPPLARTVERKEVIFIHPTAGFYAHDMVQNDPFLRGRRITMVFDRQDNVAALMAARFPGYRKIEEGSWGERWTAVGDSPAMSAGTFWATWAADCRGRYCRFSSHACCYPMTMGPSPSGSPGSAPWRYARTGD